MKFLIISVLLTVGISASFAQQIAITFDDAPTANGPSLSGQERTIQLINRLKTAGVEEAAFFVITGALDSNGKDRISQYIAAGHVVANHSHSHQWIHRMGTQSYCDDVRIADSLLRPFFNTRPWFRYPFLDEGRKKTTRDSIRQTLKDLGLSNGYVTVDTYDWYINQQYRKALTDGKRVEMEKLKQFYVNHVVSSVLFYDSIAKAVLQRSPRHVLLLHENDLAAMFIVDVVSSLKALGWQIIKATEAYNDPIARHIPEVLFNGQGRVAAIAREQGIPGAQLMQPSEDEVYLDSVASTLGLFR
jgi:peptidoglycan-N-acetylglucosamine deacetylase